MPDAPPTGSRPRRVHLGPQTRERFVLVADCPVLATLGLLAAGVTDPGPQLEIGGDDWYGSVLVIGLSGRGQCRIGGLWQDFPAGSWYQVPPYTDYGYRSAGAAWRVAWLVWAGRRGPPAAAVRRFVRPTAAVGPLFDALLDAGSTDPATAAEVAQLLDRLARRACAVTDDPLDRLWAEVAGDPARPWSLGVLARTCGLEPEGLRRRCQRSCGLSPMRQVAHLRMRAATQLLAQGASVQDAAAAVGYADRFTFSSAFRRAVGVPPSRMRSPDLSATPARSTGGT